VPFDSTHREADSATSGSLADTVVESCEGDSENEDAKALFDLSNESFPTTLIEESFGFAKQLVEDAQALSDSISV
jgi:hypothetical protein